jgi:hypothetical protein
MPRSVLGRSGVPDFIEVFIERPQGVFALPAATSRGRSDRIQAPRSGGDVNRSGDLLAMERTWRVSLHRLD